MKKLFCIFSLLMVPTLQAYTKNDLKDEICAINVAAVKEILACEKLTAKEYKVYLDLAEEVVRNRAALLTEGSDITTPYDGPSILQPAFEWMGGVFIPMVAAEILLDLPYPKPVPSKNKKYFCALVGLSVALFAKGVCDYRKIDECIVKRDLLMRKKYDDAVAIKQVVAMVEIEET